MEDLKRQIKGMEETHIEGLRLSNIYFYPDLEYPPKFQVLDFENTMGMVVWIHLYFYEIAMSQYSKNEKLLIQTFSNSLIGPTETWFAHFNNA